MISITVPLALPSLANARMHWATKARIVKEQRRQTSIHLLIRGVKWHAFSSSGHSFLVTLTRIGSRKLDSDNLQSAFKAPRDAVAACIGLDDGSPRWTWVYGQERGKPGFRIEIEAMP